MRAMTCLALLFTRRPCTGTAAVKAAFRSPTGLTSFVLNPRATAFRGSLFELAE
jgi:hypothetical protein